MEKEDGMEIEDKQSEEVKKEEENEGKIIYYIRR